MADPATVRASDLYELAVCPHRIALDRRLPRAERAAPDEATALLIERGRAWEERYQSALGWPRPDAAEGDVEAGAARTMKLMRKGVPGICQGVLRHGRHLAIPDLLRRVEGASALGPFHYEPGDIKAGLTPRADQVLQVAFAGQLLERIQERFPARGTLVLGDGREEPFPLAPLRAVLRAAVGRAERIASGEETTTPFWSEACGRCRWRRHCVPEMLERGDPSLVDGMTPTRRRVLSEAGVRDVRGLAGIDPGAWSRSGRPPIGIRQLVLQARALLDGTISVTRRFELPHPSPLDRLVWAERDPLDRERAVLVAWRTRDGSGATHLLGSSEEDALALSELTAWVERGGGVLFHFGGETPAALENLADRVGLSPALQVALEERLVDLRRTLRQAASVLPVRRYLLEEVDAVLDGRPLPDPGLREDPAFVLAEHRRRGTPGDWHGAAARLAQRRLDALERLLAWMRNCGWRPAEGGAHAT